MKLSLTKVTAFVLSAIVIWLNFQYIPHCILSWDVFGYYLYLPATFIYNDLGIKDLTALDLANAKYNMTPYYYQFTTTATGAHANIYQLGMAMLYLPFFLIGHVIALVGLWPVDGFSAPYAYSVWGGGMLYSVLGIFGLRRLLLRFFDERITALTLLLIIAGTNYLLHSTIYASNLMTANILFTLYVFFLGFVIRWHDSQNTPAMAGLAVIFGLMFLARPIEWLAFVLPLFWSVSNRRDLTRKWEMMKRRRGQFIMMFVILFVIGSLQLSYNYVVSGNPLSSGYKNAGEDGFYPFDNHLWSVLFSFRKGWLIYTPLMIFSLMGIFVLRKKKPGLFIPILLFTLLYLYFESSWSNWWYAAGYSQRALIQFLPVLAIPMGYFFVQAREWKTTIKIPIYILALSLLGLNLFQSWQYSTGIIHDSRMTREYYFKVFGKTYTTDDWKELLLFDRSSVDESQAVDTNRFALKKTLSYHYNEAKYFSNDFYEGNASLLIDGDDFGEKLKIPVSEITQKEFAVLEISFWVKALEPIEKGNTVLIVHQKHHKKAQKYSFKDLTDYNINQDQWVEIVYQYVTPEFKGKKDRFELYINNPGKKRLLVDKLDIKVFEKIEKE